MVLQAVGLLVLLLPGFFAYDCYNTKCWGIGTYYNRYIYCDQTYNYCSYLSYGYPICNPGWSGNGVYCPAGYNTTYYCAHTSLGVAYCQTMFDRYMAYIISGIVLGIIVVSCCCFAFLCARKRRREDEFNGIIIQTETPGNYGAAGYAAPTDYPAGYAAPTDYPNPEYVPAGYPVKPEGYQPGYQPGPQPQQPPPYKQ